MLCDGTFKTVPRLFYQLYTFHGVKKIGDRVVSFPFAYALMSSKTEEAYTHLFTVSTSHCLIIFNRLGCLALVLLITFAHFNALRYSSMLPAATDLFSHQAS